ncbi:molybdopterin-containing oxidoreductase family protein [Sulfurospirillum arcachonense]|uniref:molybdopterin-containing oxidoreductase family protein n=1 Tax=Sulfurospirillum arcachonense TaxID=57666 RepID=UPI00046A736C|nr:molybdopterin-dependent oxidoreductase [Sulfurospirillum arcachonense]
MGTTSRRKFLKGSVSTIAGVTLGGKTVSQAKTVTNADFGIEKKVPLLCRMCAQKCPAIATVRNGRLVRMEANMDTPYGGLCGRGRAAMGTLYDPDRIKTPLIRIGKRGEGKFRQASWDEALNMVSDKMKSLAAKGDQKSLAYLPRFSSAPLMDAEFFKLYGTPNKVGYGDTCFANGLTVGLTSIIGGKLDSGIPSVGTGTLSPDYENAKYGVLLQRNPGGGLVCHAWGNMFGRGKRNGMQLTVVDPRKPSEAGESDTEWLSIRPGTDAAFLLGLMNEIFKNKYYDINYLEKYTNVDMLINTTTGLPVITQNIEKEHKGKKVTITDYLVSTKDGNKFKSANQKSNLFGKYEVEVDGQTITCKTALQLMIDSCKKFSPEWAEKQSTVNAKNIRECAKKLHDAKPACFIERGYRSERYASSMREKILITQINVLMGSLGQKGGVFYNRSVKTGSFIKDIPHIQDKSVSKWYIKNDVSRAFMSSKYYRRTWIETILSEKPYKQRMAVFYGQNIIGGSSGSEKIVTALNKLETIVCISPFWNETTMYADIILPDCTFMERDEALNTKYKTPIPTIGVNRKAVEPLYESKDGYWIINQLAKRVLDPQLYEKHFDAYNKEGMMAIWKKQYAGLHGMSAKEQKTLPPLESILEGQIWTGEQKYGIKTKGTPTGKIELYSMFLAQQYITLKNRGYDRLEQSSPLPVFVKPFWIEKKEKLSNSEFIPITGFHPLGSFTGQQTKNNLLLSTINQENNTDAAFINTQKGLSLGLKSGDIIEVFNIDKPNLIIKTKVILSQTVHPDALFSYYGMGAGYYNSVAKKLHNTDDMGINPNHISNFTFNPLTAGQPGQDFIISIRKSV